MYTIEKGVLKNSSIYFHNPSNLAKSMFFYPLSAGHFYCDKNYMVKRDHYNNFLIMYVLSGSGTICYNNKFYTAKSGDVVFLNCNESHTYKTDGWETKWIHFDGNISNEYFQLIYNTANCVIPIYNSDIIDKNFNAILKCFEQNNVNEPLISCYIQRILTEFILIYKNKFDAKDIKSNSMLEIINYIEKNYKSKLNLNQLSEKACISTFHFIRLFKSETSYSPYEYITMVRLNNAKILLKTTKMSIKEIAFETGFNSVSNFVICFKKHTNMTPSKFRATPF